MSKLRDYTEFIENGDVFNAKYNTQEIVINMENEVNGDVITYRNLTLSYGANRKEYDIYTNIVSLRNIVGAEALRNLTIKLLCEMSKNIEKLNISRELKSKNVVLSRKGFKMAGQEFQCSRCERGNLYCCHNCPSSRDWESILAEVLFNFRKYLMNLDKCKDGSVLIGREETLDVGDFIKLDDKVLMIERLLITSGSEFIVIKYKTINEYFVENEIEVLKNKLKKGTPEYEKYTNMFSIVSESGV